MGKICAIHQPNFFPWLGYFDKIKKADIFVFLDDVQIVKTGSSWVNRAKLNCFGQEKWYTCPIKRESGLIPINQVEFGNEEWKRNFLNVLKNYYKDYIKAQEVIQLIEHLIYHKNYKYLADLNRDVIVYFANYFGYKTHFISKSFLGIESSATPMLIDICKAVGADTYLCGGGAAGYQQDELFNKHGVTVVYQEYAPQPYGEPQRYLPGLSIIDYLMDGKR
jgi:WbqC-like protein family